MGYSDQKYQTRVLTAVADNAVATGTITASGTNTLSSSFPVPTFSRRTQINSVKVLVKTAPATNLTGVTLALMNGTTTFATCTIGTNTANSTVNGTVSTAASAIFGSSSGPTVNVIGVGTASGQSYGAYDVWFETQELPA